MFDFMFYGEKPDYNRKKVKVDIKPVLKVANYDSMPIFKFSNYITSVIESLMDKDKEYTSKEKIQIEFEISEESEGYDYPTSYILFQPYYERKETDDEYNERIKEEEESYNKYLESERLKKEEYAQYEKDLAEYERIKEKYRLL